MPPTIPRSQQNASRLGISAKKKPAYPCGRSLGHPWPWRFREKGNETLDESFYRNSRSVGFKMPGAATPEIKSVFIDLTNCNNSAGRPRREAEDAGLF